jgi:transposase
MESVLKILGIDVSEKYLDISVGGEKPFRLLNSVEGIAQLLLKVGLNIRVYLESSGGYERLSCRELTALGIDVRVLSALRMRRLAQGNGPKAKTDKIDAKILAKLGPALDYWRHPRSIAEEEALDISRAIEACKEAAALFKRRAKKPCIEPQAKQAYLEAIRFQLKKAKELQKAFEEKVKGTPLGEMFELAMSVPCIKQNLARQIVSEFPDDIRNRKHKQLASYAGLAPIDDSSGESAKTSRVGKGCARLKKALYMPALNAVKTQKWAQDAYYGLRAKGKHHLVAIVAVMRRLLIRAITVIQRGSPWQGEPPRD